VRSFQLSVCVSASDPLDTCASGLNGKNSCGRSTSCAPQRSSTDITTARWNSLVFSHTGRLARCIVGRLTSHQCLQGKKSPERVKTNGEPVLAVRTLLGRSTIRTVRRTSGSRLADPRRPDLTFASDLRRHSDDMAWPRTPFFRFGDDPLRGNRPFSLKAERWKSRKALYQRAAERAHAADH